MQTNCDRWSLKPVPAAETIITTEREARRGKIGV